MMLSVCGRLLLSWSVRRRSFNRRLNCCSLSLRRCRWCSRSSCCRRCRFCSKVFFLKRIVCYSGSVLLSRRRLSWSSFFRMRWLRYSSCVRSSSGSSSRWSRNGSGWWLVWRRCGGGSMRLRRVCGVSRRSCSSWSSSGGSRRSCWLRRIRGCVSSCSFWRSSIGLCWCI